MNGTVVFSILRFLAAIIVIFFHCRKGSQLLENAPKIFIAGPQMVTFFFVLSGFVLMFTYGNKKEIAIKTYLIKRIFRIYPAYVLALFLSFDLHYFHINIKALILNLFFLQSWIPPYPLSINGPGWFLSDLMAFYLLFPLFFKLIRKFPVSPNYFLAFSMLFWVVTQIILTILLNTNFYQGYPSISHDIIFYFPLAHLCSFLAGVSGGYFLVRNKKSKKQYIGTTISVILSILIISLFIENQSNLTKILSVRLPYDASFYAPFFLILIIQIPFVKIPTLPTHIYRTVCLIGAISYPMYIMQGPIRLIVYPRLKHLNLSYDSILFLYLTFLTLTCLIILNFYEKPIRKRLNKFIQQNSQQSAALDVDSVALHQRQ